MLVYANGRTWKYFRTVKCTYILQLVVQGSKWYLLHRNGIKGYTVPCKKSQRYIKPQALQTLENRRFNRHTNRLKSGDIDNAYNIGKVYIYI